MINGVEDVAAATIKVSYNPSVIVVTDVGGSDFQSFTPNLFFADKGWVKMAAYQVGSGLSGDIKFAEIKLRAAGKVNKSCELSLEIKELKDNEGRSVRFERKNGFFSITGEEKTEALSAAIGVWGILGVMLLIVVIAGVRYMRYIKKKRQ
jgi:hypothetical protein